MTIFDLLKRAQTAIAGDSARLDAELLLAFCLERNRSFLYAWPEKVVDDTVARGITRANLVSSRGYLGCKCSSRIRSSPASSASC